MDILFTSACVNSLGLALDIVGALVLWRFGLPKDVRRDGKFFLVINNGDQNEKMRADRYDSYSRCAIFFLIGGFLLQIASNYL